METLGPDGVTDRERALARARLENPTASLAQLAKIAGVKNCRVSDARKALRRPRVRAWLLHPPPTASAQALRDFSALSDSDRKSHLLKFYGEILQDGKVAVSERIRAAREVAEMTVGAKVPAGLKITAGWDMQKFVEMAGGKPEGELAGEPEEMPN